MKTHKNQDRAHEPIKAHSKFCHESRPHTRKSNNKHTQENIAHHTFYSNYCPICHCTHNECGHFPKYKGLKH
jgi:hypothetical protein